MFARKFVARMLVAAVAVFAASTAAKADMNLSVSFGPSTLFTTGNIPTASITSGTPVTGTSGVISGSGYSFSFSYALTSTGSTPTSLQLAITSLTGTAPLNGNTGSLNFSLTGTGHIGNATGTGYASPSPGQVSLSSDLSAFTAGGLGGISELGSVEPPVSFSTPARSTVGTSGPALVVITNPFTLRTSDSITYAATGFSGAAFTSSVTVAAVPEPASIVAGLMGLPCVGGLLAVARRRMGGVVELVA